MKSMLVIRLKINQTFSGEIYGEVSEARDGE
jgi:hypothetical protein